MPSRRRSESKHAVNEIRVNWLFLHPKYDVIPFNIVIPPARFKDCIQYCRGLFATEIRSEHQFRTNHKAIRFYKPKRPIVIKGGNWKRAFKDGKSTVELEFIDPPTVFSEALDGEPYPRHLHLVVAVRDITEIMAWSRKGQGSVTEPGLPEVKRFLKALKKEYESPSTLAKSNNYADNQKNRDTAIYDGRYAPRAKFTPLAPPIQIFHPVFENFLRRLADPELRVTNDDVRATQELMDNASGVFPTEAQRSKRLKDLLTKLLGYGFHVEVNEDGTSPDGVITLELTNSFIRIHLVILEVKREWGEGGCDVVTQAGLSLRQRWVQPGVSDIRNRCCCPTFLVAGGGSWLGVLGGVFTDKFIIQRLTDMMSIGHSSTHGDSRVHDLARVFVALRRTIPELVTFYEQTATLTEPIDITCPDKPHPRLYPYPASFESNGRRTNFRYLRALEDDPGCVAFLAETDDPEPRRIVVKYVSRYGEDVHRFLASQDLAPELHYFGTLPDILPLPSARPENLLPIMNMAVMDYVEPSEVPPSDARQQLLGALAMLHNEGYVLGDLRPPNILFDVNGHLKLIDFDWAGRYMGKNGNSDDIDSYVCYPLALSRTIQWPQGAGELELILPQHDLDMLDTYYP